MIINDKRALAYVVTIDEIKPIEGYDRVEYARTNGWWVIISKSDKLEISVYTLKQIVKSMRKTKDLHFQKSGTIRLRRKRCVRSSRKDY